MLDLVTLHANLCLQHTNNRVIAQHLDLGITHILEEPESPQKASTGFCCCKSIVKMSTTDALGDKENFTVDTASLTGLPAKNISGVKQGRSKSIGPGGLDAHESGAESRQKVRSSTAKLKL